MIEESMDPKAKAMAVATLMTHQIDNVNGDPPILIAI